MSNTDLKLLEWIADPVIFFKDVFGQDPYPYQAKIMRELRNLDINRVLICAAGGTGKTKLIGGIGLYGAIVLPELTKQPYRVIILGGSGQQSHIVYGYIKDAIRDNPKVKSMIDGDPLQSITKFKNKSVIKALTKSFKSIYGQHGDLVIIDEAVEAGDFVIRDSFRIIGESPYSRIILSTTPHDYTSLFVDMWSDKKEYPDYNLNKRQIGAWKRYSWSTMNCPRITTQMIKEAKQHLPEWMFQVYWMGKPYPLIGTMVSLDKVKVATKDNPIFKYEEKYDHPIIGFDWGFHPNPGAGILVQKKEDIWYVLKYKLFHKIHPDKVLDWIETTARDYNISHIFVDSADIGEYLRLMDRGLPVYPIKFKNEKFIMQSNLTNIFEKELIKIPEDFIPITKQLRKYTYDTKVDEDLVDALMLAIRKEGKPTASLYYKILKPEKKKHYF